MGYKFNPLPKIFDRVTEDVPPAGDEITFVTQVNTPSVSVAQNINFSGSSTTENDPNGIRSRGDAGGDNLYTELTNRLTGTGSTVGTATADIITLALGSTAGTYTFDCRISGFDTSTPSGVGYAIVGAVRTNGTAATLLTGQAVDSFEEAATTACSAEIVVSGNSAIFRVTGATGLNLSWNGVGEYVFVG